MFLLKMFLLINLSFGEEIERSPRGLDSQAFRALLDVGNFISKFGVENFEKDLKGTFSLISHNIFVFYFLLIAAITSQLLTFALTIFAIRARKRRAPSVYPDISLHSDIPYDTNDREYWISDWV